MKQPNETLPRDVVLSGADICVQILGGTTTLKFGITKNIQNLTRFRTTFNIERKYLWNG